MTRPRIVLSCFLLLSPALLACEAPAATTADDEPLVASGIGTSPSGCVDACDPEGIGEGARLAPESGAPASCGVWFDVSTAAADARALACMPPDAVVHVAGHSTCIDALDLAGLRPTEAVVRHVGYNGAAVQASCAAPASLHQVEQAHPPIVAPAMMMEWRAPAPRPVRAPLKAAFPFLAVLAILAPLIQTVVGKIFTSQVKDSNRRTQILGYADTAFQLVEALGPQLGLTGHEKYVRFVQRIVDSLKAAGQPELTAQELQQLQGLAQVKAMLAKAPVPPARPPLPLPPPPRG